MLMRDGMPGPGWWIASDGRWYPPELHPDMRAPAVVVVDKPPALTLSDESLSMISDTPHAVSNGRTVGATNGALFATRASNGTTAATIDTADAADNAPSTETAKANVRIEPSRSGRQRLVIGLGLAVGAFALIIYIAGGHDKRPSLESRAANSVTTTTESSATVSSVSSVPSVSPSVAPGATAATSTARPGSAPSTVTSPTTTPSASSVTRATTVTSAARITPRVVSVFELVKGNCLDGASLNDGLVTTIRVVDCTEVHTHEVYYSGRYPESSFDATKLSAYANDTCLAQFAPYVGIDYTRSRYQYLHIVPTQESWTRDNDRDVVCVAFDEDSTIVGTIAGRAQ